MMRKRRGPSVDSGVGQRGCSGKSGRSRAGHFAGLAKAGGLAARGEGRGGRWTFGTFWSFVVVEAFGKEFNASGGEMLHDPCYGWRIQRTRSISAGRSRFASERGVLRHRNIGLEIPEDGAIPQTRSLLRRPRPRAKYPGTLLRSGIRASRITGHSNGPSPMARVAAYASSFGLGGRIRNPSARGPARRG